MHPESVLFLDKIFWQFIWLFPGTTEAISSILEHV